jgi:hypothetical protein
MVVGKLRAVKELQRGECDSFHLSMGKQMAPSPRGRDNSWLMIAGCVRSSKADVGWWAM